MLYLVTVLFDCFLVSFNLDFSTFRSSWQVLQRSGTLHKALARLRLF